MSRALRFAFAAVVAAIVETGCLWVLTHVNALHYLVAVALAFTAGYLALFAGIRVLAPSRGSPPLCAEVRTYSLLGLSALLLVTTIVYVSIDLLSLSLRIANSAALVAIVCWIALGWGFVGGDARQSPSAPTNAAKDE
jgi:putative flippase GtrA